MAFSRCWRRGRAIFIQPSRRRRSIDPAIGGDADPVESQPVRLGPLSLVLLYMIITQ
jgi:hypothetical protein